VPLRTRVTAGLTIIPERWEEPKLRGGVTNYGETIAVRTIKDN